MIELISHCSQIEVWKILSYLKQKYSETPYYFSPDYDDYDINIRLYPNYKRSLEDRLDYRAEVQPESYEINNLKGKVIYLIYPEVCRHPKNQNRLIKELVKTQANLVIFTVSEHILNAVRVLVSEEVLTPAEVRITYLSKKGSEKLTLDPRGRIDSWPEEFFDQMDVDLEMLLGAKAVNPTIYKDGGIDSWPDEFFDQVEKDLMDLL